MSDCSDRCRDIIGAVLLYQLLYRILNAVLKSAASLARIEVALQAQDEKLERILTAVEPLPAVGFRFAVETEGQLEEGVNAIDMTNSQQATATITPVDKKGNPAAIDGIPVWASSDETILTVAPAADGLSAVVAAVGPLGSAKVSVSGDADLGPGSAPIFGTLDVSVTQGQAVGFKIDLGTPTEQP